MALHWPLSFSHIFLPMCSPEVDVAMLLVQPYEHRTVKMNHCPWPESTLQSWPLSTQRSAGFRGADPQQYRSAAVFSCKKNWELQIRMGRREKAFRYLENSCYWWISWWLCEICWNELIKCNTYSSPLPLLCFVSLYRRWVLHCRSKVLPAPKWKPTSRKMQEFIPHG